MTRYLIVNLKRHGDILSSAHLINSIFNHDSSVSLDILVYKEFEESAQCLEGIDQIHVIDRKKIITLKKGPLFSDGFALNHFHRNLKNLRGRYLHIVNLSNDHVSAYITSYLTYQGTIHHGMRFAKNNHVEPSSRWAVFFNEVLTKYENTPLHFTDCHHRILNIPLRRKNISLKTNPDHDETAEKNFNLIREQTRSNEEVKKIIGIQLKSSMREKDIPQKTLVSLIKYFLDDQRYFPILLIAPLEKEREESNEINRIFDNALVCVESDFIAGSSVIKNLDLMVTPDTSYKHIADIAGTPIVEVSLGHAPFLKQGTRNTRSFVLSQNLKDRHFKIKKDAISFEISSKDIKKTVDYVLFGEDPSLSNTALYCVKKDNLGIRYDLIFGYHSPVIEITRMMARYYTSSIMKEPDTLFPDDILKFPIKEINGWVYDQKNQVNDAIRYLLGTLRSLVSIKGNHEQFIHNLDKLLEYGNKSSLVAIPTLLFSAEIEELSGMEDGKDMKRIEQSIYKLKNDYQTALDCIRTLEKNCFDHHVKKSKQQLDMKREIKDEEYQI